MAVLRGNLLETRYSAPTDKSLPDRMEKKEATTLSEGEVHLINEQMGLHKMELLDENQTAVTLHYYIPPYHDCLTYIEGDGEIRTEVSHTTYDTEFGEVVSNSSQ